MSEAFKPEGYCSVSPYLIVDGAAGTVQFLAEVLDAVLIRKFEDGGRIRHAEVRIDDSVVMIADGIDGWPPVPSHVHMYVPDVDVAFQRAVSAGGIVVQEPSQKVDEDRRCGVKDSGGTTWWLATRVGLPAE
jgi:PhnB protein